MVPDDVEVRPVVDIRRDMAERLPSLLQPFFTWLTGRHCRLLKPERKRSRMFRLVAAIASVVIGVAITAFGLTLSFAAAAVLDVMGWTLTVGGARNIQVQILHHAAHGTLFRSRRWNRITFQVLSTIFFIQDYDGFFQDHVVIHHTHPADEEVDPDARFQWMMGFRPGMSRQELWRRFWLTLFSPRFHWLFLKARWRANLCTATKLRRLGSIVFLSVLLAFAWSTGCWVALLIGWIFPLTFIYHISAIAQFMSEHYWYSRRRDGEPWAAFLVRITPARYCGEPLPSSASGCWVWCRWISRLVLVHLLIERMGVMVGDLSDHPLHHVRPGHDWANSRTFQLEYFGNDSFSKPPVVWGLGTALDLVFCHLEKLPPRPAEVCPKEMANKVMLGM